MRGLAGVVLRKSAELTPAGRTVEQGDFPNGDPAEAHPHRQGDDVQAVQQVAEIGGTLHQMARSRFSQYGLRRSFLSSLPVGFRGSTSIMSTLRGHL